jgi:HJR/Mrr/RecB family endonuclease
LITLRTTRDLFQEIDLRHVEALACPQHLSAAVSRNPAELAPVRPVLEFNMVDPRFVAESDALSTLDTRPNLMSLSPTEFEALIQNLFTTMGLEAKQTRPSRDGGVDCVAYDPRPIFGGKVVIQAKRYRHTVGVSAVRDLFGTLQNEGASKGILVTTSGYGSASFEFAQNKPIELINGAQLLFLLLEHAGVEARIVAPRRLDRSRGGQPIEARECDRAESWPYRHVQPGLRVRGGPELSRRQHRCKSAPFLRPMIRPAPPHSGRDATDAAGVASVRGGTAFCRLTACAAAG